MKKLVLSSSLAIAASVGSVNATPLFSSSTLGTQQEIISTQLGEEKPKAHLILELCCGYFPGAGSSMYTLEPESKRSMRKSKKELKQELKRLDELKRRLINDLNSPKLTNSSIKVSKERQIVAINQVSFDLEEEIAQIDNEIKNQ
ncbi:MAG: hypothetical protein MK212_15925 [Saprospiraceae bacterium]|nr:hypothetical protein [Saprospiraceae bacterium]